MEALHLCSIKPRVWRGGEERREEDESIMERHLLEYSIV